MPDGYKHGEESERVRIALRGAVSSSLGENGATRRTWGVKPLATLLSGSLISIIYSKMKIITQDLLEAY